MGLFISCGIYAIQVVYVVLYGSYGGNVFGLDKGFYGVGQAAHQQILAKEVEQLVVNGVGHGLALGKVAVHGVDNQLAHTIGYQKLFKVDGVHVFDNDAA